MTLHFDPFSEPDCPECRLHISLEGDRLYDSWRAVILDGGDLGEVMRAYFRAFHANGHQKSTEEKAVDDAEDRPVGSFRRFLRERHSS